MSAKILSSLTDENPNVQKQIGCMNGIFQLFDRHHFLTGRRLSSPNNKKLLPGPNPNVELPCARQEAMQRIRTEIVDEKHRPSTESSMTSSSSSFSSVDHQTTSKSARTPSRRHSFTEKQPQTTPRKHQSFSMNGSRESHDLRDVVKGSMYREARGLSIKTVAKEEGKSYVLKHMDSPRPLQNLKPVQQRVTGSDISTRAPATYREAPWISREEKDTKVHQDPHRFSYDGRELRDATKCSIKLKELPRLSLDSRDTRSHALKFTPASLARDSSVEKGICSQILNQDPSSNKRSTVIAKLMGLESFPDHFSADQGKAITSDEDSTLRSSQTADLNRPNSVPLSPHLLQKDPTSPRPTRTNLGKKATPTSRFPLEQAPWRQQNANKETHNLAGKDRYPPATAPYASSTIYGEIEKRLTDLKFNRSGKDLRALKQILEAMQKTRNRLEHQHEKVGPESQTGIYSSCDQHLRSLTKQNQENISRAPTIKGASHSEGPESSIVIMKPKETLNKSRNLRSPSVAAAELSHFQNLRSQDAKTVSSVDKRIGRDQRPMRSNPQDPGWGSQSEEKKSKGRTPRLLQISKERKHWMGESFTEPIKSSGTMSPRTKQKQDVVDKQNQSNIPSSDLRAARAQSSLSNRKSKLKSTERQRGEDRMRKLDRELRHYSHQDESASLQSESSHSSASPMYTGFTTSCSYENDCKQPGDCKDRDLALRMRKDVPIAELVIPTAEQPSPVSVLDASFYREGSPSPVKKKSTPFTDDDSLDAEEAQWNQENLDHLQEIGRLNHPVEFTKKKLEEIRSLVHKLDQLNPVHGEDTTAHINSHYDSPNPDHRYITKILLASGLLKDMSLVSTPFQLHSSGHVINPKLFHVLEQTEGPTEFCGEPMQMKLNQKIQRKIVFDTVNEILARKLSSESSISLGRRSGSGLQLLKELHTEFERLHKVPQLSQDDEDDQLLSMLDADMTHQLEDWKDYRSETPCLVLDIERLIFKDLISEVIHDEIAGHQNWPRHCRKLFAK